MSWRERAEKLFSSIRRRIYAQAPVPVVSSATTAYPVLLPLRTIYQRLTTTTNKYELCDMLCDLDPHLEGAVNRQALLARYAYKGMGVSIGKELEKKEEQLLKVVLRFENKFDIPGLFYSSAKHLVKYGDDIHVVKIEDGAGLTDMRALPIHYMTAIEKKEQLQDAAAQIFKPNIYVLNEMSEPIPEGKQTLWPNDKNETILHIGLNSRAEAVYDLLKRYTFGVWSKSPLECLKVDLTWKLALRINDILLRQKIVPRYHHKLDLTAFDPSLFEGETVEDRIAAAKAKATAHMTDYKSTLTDPLKEVDRDYITGKEVEITSIEPKRVSYVDPNLLIEQINTGIFAATGAQESAVKGRGAGTFASELVVASNSALSALVVADTIKTKVIDLTKRHVKALYKKKYSEDDLMKIDIRLGLALGVERGEAARRAAILSAMNIATVDELRDEVGLYKRLDKKEKKRLIDNRSQGRNISSRTIEDIIAAYIQRTEPAKRPETPESKSQQQVT